MRGINELQRFVRRARKSGLQTAIERAVTWGSVVIFGAYVEWKMRTLGKTGTDFISKDWDTLVLLDACRYDVFSEENTVDGELRAEVSPGRNSMEFMLENFAGKTLHETVYVTSNPHATRLEDDIFHAVVDEPLTEGWDDEWGTVFPEVVTQAALEAHERFPKKRIIVHYMQPHMPYVSESARAIYPDDGSKGWGKIEHGEQQRWRVSDELEEDDADLLRDLYTENLQLALESVSDFVSKISGKTVVTSDHGEFLYDRPHPLWPTKVLGHGNGRRYPRCDELCKVPWLVLDGDERREIVSEPPIESSDELGQETVEKRLEDLGYLS